MIIGKQIYNFFNTRNTINLINIINNKNYNKITKDNIIYSFLQLHDILKLKGYQKYENDIINKSVMLSEYKNELIPLEIKTSINNEISRDILIELYETTKIYNSNFCYLLLINPTTLYNYNTTEDLKYILFKYDREYIKNKYKLK